MNGCTYETNCSLTPLNRQFLNIIWTTHPISVVVPCAPQPKIMDSNPCTMDILYNSGYNLY